MKNKFILTVVSACLILGLVGCSSNSSSDSNSKTVTSYTYHPADISEIKVDMGSALVSVVGSSSEDIEVKYSTAVATVENGVLKVNVPMPKAGIHLKDPEPLTIMIPDTYQQPIKITSEYSNVNVSDVNVSQLDINTEFGNIVLSGLEGHITAKSEMDEIKTSLDIGSDIEDLTPYGKSLDAMLGNSTNEISVYSNTGVIEIK